MSEQRRGRLADEELVGAAVAAVAVTAVAAVWGGAWAAHAVGAGPKPSGNPLVAAIMLLRGKTRWTGVAKGAAGAIVAAAVVAAVVVATKVAGGHHVDRQARHLRRSAGDRRYTARHSGDGPGGLLWGTLAGTRTEFRSTWEDVAVVIAGARMGKSSAIAVPQICAAPGAVFATSNKRDLVDSTRNVRAKQGQVWVFDPQALASNGAPTFWWNPLDVAADIAGARRLAAIFAQAASGPNAVTDSYFDHEGQVLAGRLLLAAAAAGQPVATVLGWLSAEQWDTAIDALAAAGQHAASRSLEAVASLPDRQRAGVVGTAAKIVGFLEDPRIAAWVTDPGDDSIPRLSAEQFVASTGTLYALSREGPGSAGALTAALTAAVAQAAEELAARSPNGRLPVPMLAELDEVANVCRWAELPDLYSHYGSRGIVLVSLLQSWSQGVQCWGREGMAKLWSAANVRVYAGGAVEQDFLEPLSALCGEHEVTERSDSQSRGRNGHASTSWSTRRQRIFTMDSLAALPRWRAVVVLSGATPKLVATTPWWESPWAKAIETEPAAR